MYTKVFIIFFTLNRIHAWSGIVIDAGGPGSTQLYVPDNRSTNTPNVDFGLSHFYAQAAVVLNARAYFTGGTNHSQTNAVTIFNPSTNRSTAGVPMNIARYVHAATVVNDTILVCGGHNGSTSLSSCEQYTPSTHKWNMITPLPAPTANFVMITLHNRAYTFGGSGACSSPSAVYMFDGRWIRRSSFLGVPYEDHAGIALDTDRALICGGQASNGRSCGAVSDCFIYSALSDEWTRAKPMTTVRTGHTMVMFKGENCVRRLHKCYKK
jgi:hypothetical protein